MKILVAKGEPKDMYQYLRILSKQYEFNFIIEWSDLEIGDYLVITGDNDVGDIAIERKSSGDFISSIIDGRIFRQVVSMGENFNRSVVIVEGNIYDSYSNLHDNSKVGALGSLIVKYGTSIIHSKNKEYTAYLILSILKHANMTIDFSKIFRPKATMGDREIGALSCAEGIGGGLAEKVIKYFRLRDIANIRDPSIISDKVHGMGKTKATNLINLFSGFEDSDFISGIDILNFEWFIIRALEYYFQHIKDDYTGEWIKIIKVIAKYFKIKPGIKSTFI
jgi:ERCC4-type nuclease